MSRTSVFSLAYGAAFAGIVMAAPVQAMDQAGYDSAQATLASALYDLEGNLIEKEAIEMNSKALEPQMDSILARYADYNGRIEQHNSYCQGTFEEPEYSRRMAECDAMESQINELFRQLDLERDAVNEQMRQLQDRDTRRQEAAQPIFARLEAGMVALVTVCFEMTLEQQHALCHYPSAPGPRTQPMVADMNATIVSVLDQTVH